jgi:hypothetical protein
MRGRRSEVRAHFIPAFGDRPLEEVTAAEIERWRSSLGDTLSVRSKNKLVIELRGIVKRRAANAPQPSGESPRAHAAWLPYRLQAELQPWLRSLRHERSLPSVVQTGETSG